MALVKKKLVNFFFLIYNRLPPEAIYCPHMYLLLFAFLSQQTNRKQVFFFGHFREYRFI